MILADILNSKKEFKEAVIVVLLFVLLGVGRHHGNIKRLLNGTERKIGEKKTDN